MCLTSGDVTAERRAEKNSLSSDCQFAAPRFDPKQRASLGHNGGQPLDRPAPALKNDRLAGKTTKQIYQMCIWESSEPSIVKLFLLCVARFFDADGRSSSMSYKQVAANCSIDERTAKKIAKRVAAADYEFAKFRAHFIGSGEIKASWPMTWEKWVLNEVQWRAQRPSGGRFGGKPSVFDL